MPTNKELALEVAFDILVNVPLGGVVVLDYYDAPEELQAFSENGGDEDYILVHSNDFVNWSACLAVCNEDTYHLGRQGATDCYITITAHA